MEKLYFELLNARSLGLTLVICAINCYMWHCQHTEHKILLKESLFLLLCHGVQIVILNSFELQHV